MTSFKENFIKYKKDQKKLEEILSKTENEEICETILENAGEDFGLSIWTSAVSLIKDEEKLMELLKDVSCEVSDFPPLFTF